MYDGSNIGFVVENLVDLEKNETSFDKKKIGKLKMG